MNKEKKVPLTRRAIVLMIAIVFSFGMFGWGVNLTLISMGVKEDPYLVVNARITSCGVSNCDAVYLDGKGEEKKATYFLQGSAKPVANSTKELIYYPNNPEHLYVRTEIPAVIGFILIGTAIAALVGSGILLFRHWKEIIK